jgi:hypothetical protein
MHEVYIPAWPLCCMSFFDLRFCLPLWYLQTLLISSIITCYGLKTSFPNCYCLSLYSRLCYSEVRPTWNTWSMNVGLSRLFSHSTWSPGYRWPIADSAWFKAIKHWTMAILRRKFKQWWSSIPAISTKRTITSHLSCVHWTKRKNTPRKMT